MRKQENLNTLKDKLTEQDINEIIAIVGYRCRIKTLNRLRSILTYSPSSIGNYGIYDRLMKEESPTKPGVYGWFYCAGQSYTDEIRTVKDCILGKIY